MAARLFLRLSSHPGMRAVAVISLTVLAAVRMVEGSPGADPARQLYLLSHLDTAVAASLWALLVGALLVVGGEDRARQLETLRAGRGGTVVAFAAARVVVMGGVLVVSAVVLQVEVMLLGVGAGWEQWLHVLVMVLDRLPFAVVALALTTSLTPPLALLGALTVHAAGNEVAYDRVAAAQGLAPESLPLHLEQSAGLFLPHPLVDALARRLVENASSYIHQFPVRQSPGIWGGDLTAASTATDVLVYGAYGVVLLALYVFAVRRVAVRNARRITLRPLVGS